MRTGEKIPKNCVCDGGGSFFLSGSCFGTTQSQIVNPFTISPCVGLDFDMTHKFISYLPVRDVTVCLMMIPTRVQCCYMCSYCKSRMRPFCTFVRAPA